MPHTAPVRLLSRERLALARARCLEIKERGGKAAFDLADVEAEMRRRGLDPAGDFGRPLDLQAAFACDAHADALEAQVDLDAARADADAALGPDYPVDVVARVRCRRGVTVWRQRRGGAATVVKALELHDRACHSDPDPSA
jgi:hypothetical protein